MGSFHFCAKLQKLAVELRFHMLLSKMLLRFTRNDCVRDARLCARGKLATLAVRPCLRPLAALVGHSVPLARAASTLTSTGPFDTGLVTSPADFDKVSDAAVRVGSHLAREVEASLAKEISPEEALRTLRLLDAVSDTLCKVLDFAECLRNTAADPAWREAAEGAHAKLGEFLYALNAHAPLHQALARITSDASLMARLTHSERRMAILLRREFEKDGIHLPEQQRGVLVRLNAEAARLGNEFSAGTAPSGDQAAQVPLPSFPSLWSLPADVRNQLWMATPSSRRPLLLSQVAAAARSARGGGDGYTVLIPVPSAAAHSLQRSCADAAVRRAIVETEARMHAANVARLEALRDKRTEIAQLAGHASHAHAVTFDRLAGDPANAVAFLQMLSAATLPRALEEMAALAEEKAAATAAAATPSAVSATAEVHPATRRLFSAGQHDHDASTPGSDAHSNLNSTASTYQYEQRIEDAAVRLVAAYARGGAVQPWDVRFYSERLLHRIGGEASRAAVAAAGGLPAVKAAYALPNVLRGLAAVCERVFGVRLRASPLAPGEAWDGGREYALAAVGAGDGSAASKIGSQSGLSRFANLFGSDSGGASGSAGLPPSHIIKIELLEASLPSSPLSSAASPVAGPSSTSATSSSSASTSAASASSADAVIGVMYLDMRPRSHKFPGAAQFVVCSAKEVAPQCDGLLERELRVAATPTLQALVADGDRVATFQRPRVALVCNFDPGDAAEDMGTDPTDESAATTAGAAATSGSSTAASISATSDASSAGGSDSYDIGSLLPPHLQRWVLSPAQVITLWHESGHMLHSLLSRVPFQHLSGTRAAFDFVEVPSHTVERFARDYRSAATWALMRPESSGATSIEGGSDSGSGSASSSAGAGVPVAVPVPREYFHFQHVQAAVTSPSHVFAALELQAGISLSLFDLALHGDGGIVDSIVNPRPADHAGAPADGAAVGAAAARQEFAGSHSLIGDHNAMPPMHQLVGAIEQVAREIAEEHEHAAAHENGKAKPASLLSIIHTPAGRLGVLNRLRDAGFVPEEVAYIRSPAFSATDVPEKRHVQQLEDQLCAPVAEPLEIMESKQQQSQGRGGGSTSASKRAWHRDSTALYRAVLQRYSLVPPVQGSTHHASLSHLVTYGGGYYAYTYAAAISAALWQRLFEREPWSAGAGGRMRRELLSQGGAEDPAVILQRLLAEDSDTGDGASSAVARGNGKQMQQLPRRGIPLAPLLREMALLPASTSSSVSASASVPPYK